MIIKKFTAKTESDALDNARKELGEGVVVMNVKEVKGKGFFGLLKPRMFEVTVALEEESEKYTAAVSAINNVIASSQGKESPPVQTGTPIRAEVPVKKESSAIEEKLDSLQSLLEQQLQRPDEEKEEKEEKAGKEEQKEEKKAKIRASYDEVIGDLESVLPFDKVFDSRYLNQTYKLATAQADIKSKVEKVRTDLETIDSLESKYKLNAKDVYIKTLDLSKALAENKRLSDLEEKLEAEKRRKAEEEAERKRLAEERKKAAEERERLAEEQRKAREAQLRAEQESVSKQPESVTEQPQNVIESPENGTEPAKNVSNGTENGTQGPMAAVDPFTQQQASEQPKAQEKRYQTRFYAKGTRGQLEALIQFMNENNIEYGRIKA